VSEIGDLKNIKAGPRDHALIGREACAARTEETLYERTEESNKNTDYRKDPVPRLHRDRDSKTHGTKGLLLR